MKAWFRRLVSVAAVVAAMPAVSGDWFGADFSAKVVQSFPNGTQVSGRMHVAGGRVRTELSHNGQQRVEIFLPAAQRSLTLYPEQKTYEERFLPSAPPKNRDIATPCDNDPRLVCTLAGEDEQNGRRVRRWTVAASGDPDNKIQGTIWTDVQNGFPIKQSFGDTLISELIYRGIEVVNGRSAEKWDARMRTQSGETIQTTQWYDPAIRTALRQELPGGVVRELQDVSIGRQPDDLFKVPDGYRKSVATAEQKDE